MVAGEGEGIASSQPPKDAKPQYVHSVIVYFKKDAPPAKVEDCITDCHKVLAKIASVKGLWAGRPAEKATKDLAVKDFQVGLTILFDNFDGLKAYEDDPAHVKFVQTYLPIVEKIVVYDVMNQPK